MRHNHAALSTVSSVGSTFTRIVPNVALHCTWFIFQIVCVTSVVLLFLLLRSMRFFRLSSHSNLRRCSCLVFRCCYVVPCLESLCFRRESAWSPSVLVFLGMSVCGLRLQLFPVLRRVGGIEVRRCCLLSLVFSVASILIVESHASP